MENKKQTINEKIDKKFKEIEQNYSYEKALLLKKYLLDGVLIGIEYSINLELEHLKNTKNLLNTK